MAKFILQETFNDAVKENIVEFSMSPDEAREETVKQFEAQGVNLGNIIKDLTFNGETGQPILKEALDRLKGHISTESPLETPVLINNLEILESECNKSVPHRVLAGKLAAHEVLISILEKEISKPDLNTDLLHKALVAAIALTNHQPDIFDAEDLAIAIKILETQKDPILIRDVLQWLAKCCIMHEMNRQSIVGADVIDKLKPLIRLKNAEILRDVCTVFRCLVLDDDIRVEFGHAHEHGKLLANAVLIDLTKLLSEYEDKNVICDILLTIASLIVRHEFCVMVEDAGGLTFALDLLKKYPESLKVCGESLKFLRALAGHDGVKHHIVQQGAAPLIHNVLNIHKKNETLAKVALICVSTLTLRVKENSLAFFETAIPETIVETMKIHANSKIVQRNAAWAIRNMVSRCRDQCESFLSCGAEDLLNAAMTEHPTIQQDLKSALRDLGCKVDLKEEWTGTAKIKIAN